MGLNESKIIDNTYEELNSKLATLQDLILKMKADFNLVARNQINTKINSQIINTSEELLNRFLDNRPDNCKVINQCTTLIQKILMKVLTVFSEKGYYEANELINKYITSTNSYLEKGVCQDSSCIENGKLILITIREYLDNTDKNSITELKEILKLDNEYELFEGNEKNESKLMSVLGNETRIKILKELSKGSNYYTKLERITGLRGGHFSFHLRELKNANFVKTSKNDKSYQITTKGLKALKMIFELSKE